MKMTTDRHEIAMIVNFNRFPVIPLDMDNKPYPDCPTFIKGGEVRLAWNHKDPRYENMSSDCQLVVSDGEYKLKNYGTMLRGDFSVTDFIKTIEKANNPLVNAGQIVAVAHYSKELNVSLIRMMKVSERIDIHCSTVATLSDIEGEDEKEVDNFLAKMKRRMR